jgi:hypothetical protein
MDSKVQTRHAYYHIGFDILTAVVMRNSIFSGIQCHVVHWRSIAISKEQVTSMFRAEDGANMSVSCQQTTQTIKTEIFTLTTDRETGIKGLTTFEVPTLKQNLNSRHSNLSSRAAVTSSNRNRKIGNSSIRCSKFRATDRTLLALVMSLKLSLRERQLYQWHSKRYIKMALTSLYLVTDLYWKFTREGSNVLLWLLY